MFLCVENASDPSRRNAAKATAVSGFLDRNSSEYRDSSDRILRCALGGRSRDYCTVFIRYELDLHSVL